MESTLNGLGIKLRDSNSEFRNFGEVLDEVGAKWDSFSSVQQRAIATAFAGTRQQTKFISLMSGWSQAAEYSAVAADSAGKSAEKLAIYQESVEAKTARATAAFEQFSATMLDSQLIGVLYDGATGLLNILNGIFSAFDGFGAKVTTVTVGIAGIYAAFKSIAALDITKNFMTFFSGLG